MFWFLFLLNIKGIASRGYDNRFVWLDRYVETLFFVRFLGFLLKTIEILNKCHQHITINEINFTVNESRFRRAIAVVKLGLKSQHPIFLFDKYRFNIVS